jgi:gentisate 1,2-dioxygenase
VAVVPTARKPDDGKPDRKHNIEAMRQDYYERIAKRDIAPLWTVMSTLVPDEPVTRRKPVIWRYDDVKTLVVESGSPITAEEAKPSRSRVK